MLKKSIRQELLYSFHSKQITVMILFLALLFCGVLYLNYFSATDDYDNFQKDMAFQVSSGQDIQALLNGNYSIQTDGNSVTVNNPLKYDKVTLEQALYAASPSYALNMLFESALITFPFIFTILGQLIATSDIKNKTIKIKTVRQSRFQFGVCKQFSVIIITIIVLFIALAIAFLFGLILYQMLQSQIPFNEFDIFRFVAHSSILLKILYGVGLSIFFSEIGYSLGFLFKNAYVGIIVIGVYTYIIPDLGKYDVKNSMNYLSSRIYEFYGTVSLTQLKPGTTAAISACMLVGVFAIFLCLHFLLTVKRSSFL